VNVVHHPAAIFQALDEQIRQFEAARRPRGRQMVSSGYPSLDRALPQGGLIRGSLVEWLAAGHGSGAATLALAAACQACGESRTLVVVDRQRSFYPPAAVDLGMDAARLVLVRPDNSPDELWAIDQSLRCEGVGAVLCWLEKLDDHTFRRWQLAAEASGALGLLVRSRQAEREPSWAELRFRVTPRSTIGVHRGLARRVVVQLLRSRGLGRAVTVELELPAETNSHEGEPGHEPYRLPPAAALASAAIGLGSTGVERPDRGAL
jgi:protein ImuA